MNPKRLKIFISAYACEPGKGSEPGIGWNVVNELAKYNEVHVLTRSNNRESIESALAEKTEATPVFHYYDLPKCLTFWKRKRHGYHLYYYLWQYGAFFQYRKFVNSYGFDIVQHLTFANFAIPSLFMWCRPLTVWGPIGLCSTPQAIFKALPWKIKLKEKLREWSMEFLCKLEPMRRRMPYAADRILESGVLKNKSAFSNIFQNKIIRHPQTGINTSEPEYRIKRERRPDGKIRLLICSEFLHWKGVTFSTEIFGRIAARNKDVELWIYGSGPEKSEMERILRTHGVEQRVYWKGFVGKQEMLQALFDADILLYPSYHHGLATVILQAMFARLPIVTIAGDPIALALEEGGGIIAEGNSMEEILDDLENKTEELVNSFELRTKLGQEGRRLIETHYEWSILVQRLSNLLMEFTEK